MARIEGEIVINRSVNEVFDFVADERNEPRYNSEMIQVEKVTAGPIGVGTRFHAQSKMIGLTSETTIEFTAYERPWLLASDSRSVVHVIKSLPTADIHGTLTFDSVPEGTQMRWWWELEARGLLRWLTPVLARLGERQEQRIWSSLKRLLEAQPAASPNLNRRT